MEKQTVFFLSDHTGITVEKLGRSLLTQFDKLEFDCFSVPYINNRQKAENTRDGINKVCSNCLRKPLVFSSITDDDLRSIIKNCNGIVFDFFDTFIAPLEKALMMPSTHTTGKVHSMVDQDRYHSWMDAVNFSLVNDDGANHRHYDEADIILLGVSRSGKTPTCVYIALQFGLNAANYPLTPDDLESTNLPKPLRIHRKKLFGLTINSDQLHRIRQKRRPDSHYASIKQCQREVATAEEVYQIHKIASINTTTISIEEIATTIVNEMGLARGKV